jgi:hypothetical protein
MAENGKAKIMNIITTIPKREKQEWVEMLFRKGPHKGERVSDYPPRFPFSRRIANPMENGFLYLVFNGELIGYGKVDEHRSCGQVTVGLIPEVVGPGDELVLSGPLKPMPAVLPCQGFRNFRYTDKNLHRLSPNEVKKELRRLNLRLLD